MLDADFIILGAGLAGAATAHALRRQGEKRILILEKENVPGAHASGRNAALIRSRVEDAAIQPLMTEGAQILRAGELAPFRAVGSVLLGMQDEPHDGPHDGSNDESNDELSNVDVARHVPPARGRGLYTPDDGVIDVAALLQSYLRQQDLRLATELLSWRPIAGGVEVETNQGQLRGRVLVNAAGAWAGGIGQLPLVPYLRHLFVTTATDAVDPEWPFVWDVRGGLYFRPESGGLLMCACDEQPGEPGDYSESWSMVGRLIEKVDALQPGLRTVTDDLNMQYRWAGQRTFAPDRKFVIGHDYRQPELFWVAALGGHGVTSSPAVGRLAAELLLAGPGTTQPFGTERLAEVRDAVDPLGATS